MQRQVYHVQMKDATRSWDVYRRYTEFCRLHAALKKQVVFDILFQNSSIHFVASFVFISSNSMSNQGSWTQFEIARKTTVWQQL